MRRRSRRWFLTVAAAASAGATGCLDGGDYDEDEAADRGEEDEPPVIPYSSLDLVDVDEQHVTAFVHVDHWHLHPVEVPLDGERHLRYRFDDEHRREHPVDEHTAYARVVSMEGGSVVMGSDDDAAEDVEDSEFERDGDYEVDVEGDFNEIDGDDVLDEEVEMQTVLEVEGSKDGVVLRGLDEGSVTVVFTLEGDGEVVYSSPPVEVEVS